MKTLKSVSTIILPNVEAMMSGVWRIDRAHDLVTLTYSDNTREAGKVSAARWAQIHDKSFAIISEVQSQRRVT